MKIRAGRYLHAAASASFQPMPRYRTMHLLIVRCSMTQERPAPDRTSLTARGTMFRGARRRVEALFTNEVGVHLYGTYETAIERVSRFDRRQVDVSWFRARMSPGETPPSIRISASLLFVWACASVNRPCQG